jgi:hypothetical protein
MKCKYASIIARLAHGHGRSRKPKFNHTWTFSLHTMLISSSVLDGTAACDSFQCNRCRLLRFRHFGRPATTLSLLQLINQNGPCIKASKRPSSFLQRDEGSLYTRISRRSYTEHIPLYTWFRVLCYSYAGRIDSQSLVAAITTTKMS